MTGEILTLRALVSLMVVIGLLALSLWGLRRGAVRLPGFKSRAAIIVETAASLGDRRSMAIVAVEGRRLLVGLTPGAVSLIAELAPRAAASSDTARPEGAA